MMIEKLLQDEHEQVLFFHDKKLNFRAIIALHNTHLGPALGGIRYYPYLNLQEALIDVLRLSKAMTFKSAIAGLKLGGGKSVILAQKDHDFPKIMEKMGTFIQGLGGQYYGAEDMGVDPAAIEKIAKKTSFVTGKPLHLGGSGNPAPFTAYGVFLGMKAAVKHLALDFNGLSVFIEGVGHTGSSLIPHLLEAGAVVYIDDIHPERVKLLIQKYPLLKDFQKEKPNRLFIYAPCAIGHTVCSEKIDRLKPKIIAGAANNQLILEEYADTLYQKEIVYAPDFLINSGGVINCAQELTGLPHDAQTVFRQVDYIYEKTLEVLEKSKKMDQSTHQVAMDMARERWDIKV